MMRVLDGLLFGLLYAVVAGSVHPLDWLTGFVIGALLPRPAARPRRLSNLLDMPRFMVGLVLAVARGGATMLKVLAGGARTRKTHDVDQPFGEMTETGASAMTFAISISPGTAVSEFDDVGRRLRINAIDAQEPEAVRSWVRHFYDRYQRHVFH
jgi:multisubunit Na+/H+ antiporter MnhE subunit